MNRTTVTTAVITAIILLAGCSRDENQPIPTERDDRAALNATGGIRALTRAHDATWDADDQIGIFMFTSTTTEISEGAENRIYKTTDGSNNFAPVTTPIDQTIYFPITGETDFMAYYPYTATLGADNKTYTVDVSTQTSQKAIDLLAADKVTGKDKEHTSVAFEFSHKLVKILLTEIKPGDGLTAADLQGLTIALTLQRVQATYDVIAGGNITVDATVDKTDISLLVASDSRSAEAIVLPAASTIGMELVFTLTGGEVFRWALSNATASTQFDPGKKYSYKITISRRGLIVNSTVNDWVAGNGDNGEEGTAN